MKKNLLFTLFFSVFYLGLFAQSQEKVLYTGRFDFSDPAKPVFSQVGTSIKATFTGTEISGIFSSASGTSYLYVIVDGNADPENRYLLQIRNRKANSFLLASGLSSGTHTIEIVKTNQYDTKVVFHGFSIPDEQLGEKPQRPQLAIEFYGDSNPAGHSAWDVADGGAVIDNGGYFTYPAITGRLLNAETSNISMGGAGITNAAWRNLVDTHHLIHQDDDPSGSNLWDFSSLTPDAVVINLGANDYYSGASKDDIKTAWKNFITNNLRVYYPNAHIVLANSYGWAYNEPADYVHEAIAELKAAGDNNVSFVRFPWLWGQEHAVVNEHAGFATILASHLAMELGLPQPNPSSLSSFAPHGELKNASFEKSTLDGVADGWRPHANVNLIEGAGDAIEGNNYLTVYNTAWVNFANDGIEGQIYVVTGWMRGHKNGDLGKLKLEFKDQAQNTIGSVEGLQTLSTDWQQYTTIATAPEGTWSVWVVLVAETRDYVDFDDISMSITTGNLKTTNANKLSVKELQDKNIKIFPVPSNGEFVNLSMKSEGPVDIRLFDLHGRIIFEKKFEQLNNTKVNLPPGLSSGVYSMTLSAHKETFYKKIIIK